MDDGFRSLQRRDVETRLISVFMLRILHAPVGSPIWLAIEGVGCSCHQSKGKASYRNGGKQLYGD